MKSLDNNPARLLSEEGLGGGPWSRPFRHRRRAIRATIATLALVSITGCSGGGPTSTSPPLTNAEVANPSGTVTVWSWNIAAKALQTLTPGFEKEHPGVKVEVDMTGTSVQTRLMLSLAAGVGAPDITQFQRTDAPHYIETRRLADLTEVASKYQSMFPPSQWQDCMYQGRLYAIPWDTGPCAVFYKRDIFAKYGIDPDKIDTWDDYIKAGQEIVQKSGGKTKMMALATNDIESFYEVLLQEAHGQIFDDQGRVAINSAASKQSLDIIRRMRQAGICSDIAAYSQEWMAGFNDDTIASYPCAVWLGGTIKDATTKGAKPRWGVFRLPAVAPGGVHVANWGGSVLVIPDSCPNKAAAWRFVEYALCTKEGQLAQYEKFSLFPSFLPALQSPEMDKPDPFFCGQPVGRIFATDITQIWRLNRTAHWTEASGYITQSLSHWASVGMPDNDVFGEIATRLHERLDVPIAPPSQTASRVSL